MLERIDDTARQELEGFPNYADPETGAWVTSPRGDWTGGFWVGELWLACRATGSQRYAELAARWCRALRPRVASDTVWRSFLFYYGAALGDILLGDQAAAAIALEGARGLTGLYNQRASVLPLGAGTSERGGEQTVIDAVGPVSALWAGPLRRPPIRRIASSRRDTPDATSDSVSARTARCRRQRPSIRGRGR